MMSVELPLPVTIRRLVTLELDADADFADGVLAACHAGDAVIDEAAFDLRDAVDGLERRVNRAVAGAGIGERL